MRVLLVKGIEPLFDFKKIEEREFKEKILPLFPLLTDDAEIYIRQPILLTGKVSSLDWWRVSDYLFVMRDPLEKPMAEYLSYADTSDGYVWFSWGDDGKSPSAFFL